MFEWLTGQHRVDANSPKELYPRLVSFMGNTGTGKSTVIASLARHAWDSEAEDIQITETAIPVIGDSRSTQSTSSNIHLFHDRIQVVTDPELPLFFADSEGLGSACQPQAAKSETAVKEAEKAKAPDNIKGDSKANMGRWIKDAFNKSMQFASHPLMWGGKEPGDRRRVVEELFPKLLYNISDVIVYVVSYQEIKTMGAIFERLVCMAQAAEVSSVNRAFYPSLIVLINKCDAATQDWDSKSVTNTVLRELESLEQTSGMIKSHIKKLKEEGRPHKDIQEVLKNSFQDVIFFKLPSSNDLSRLKSQLAELYAIIDGTTKKTLENAQQQNMRLSAEQQLQLHRLAFKHFRQSPHTPFNFLDAFYKVAPPLPAKLEGSLVQLLRATLEAVQEQIIRDETPSQSLLAQLIGIVMPLVASTIALDIRRRRRPGPILHVFHGITSAGEDEGQEKTGEQQDDDKNYKKRLDNACREFSSSSLPCGFTVEDQPNRHRRCVSTKRAIHFIHRDASGLLGIGGFNASLIEEFHKEWESKFAGQLKDYDGVELPVIWAKHREALRTFHGAVPSRKLKDFRECLWCMQRIPTERLPCGHWICSACAVDMGETESDSDDRLFKIKHCDQHAQHGKALNPPFQFFNLPPTVGRRLLSLDDGGVRGILQLQLLSAIQDELGDDISVCECFDLIGGTGTGGIHALGLGIARWSVSDAIRTFHKHVPKAFVPRKVTSNFIECINNAFENRKLSMVESLAINGDAEPIRVFVTSTMSLSESPTLLKNYRHEQFRQQFETRTAEAISHRDDSVAEAAKATASFGPFFGAYAVPSMISLFVGGSLDSTYQACIVLDEAKFLWPAMVRKEEGACQVDVLVSIGCGHSTKNSDACSGMDAVWKQAFKDELTREPGQYIRLCGEYAKMQSLPKADETSFLDKCPEHWADQKINNKEEIDAKIKKSGVPTDREQFLLPGDVRLEK